MYEVAQLFPTKEPLLTDNSGNRMTSQNPKWRRAGYLKAKIGDNNFYFLAHFNVKRDFFKHRTVKTNDKNQRFGVVITPLSRKKYIR